MGTSTSNISIRSCVRTSTTFCTERVYRLDASGGLYIPSMSSFGRPKWDNCCYLRGMPLLNFLSTILVPFFFRPFLVCLVTYKWVVAREMKAKHPKTKSLFARRKGICSSLRPYLMQPFLLTHFSVQQLKSINPCVWNPIFLSCIEHKFRSQENNIITKITR